MNRNKTHYRQFSNVSLTKQDVDPILCALELVINAEADSLAQNQLNFYNCNVVSQKLRAGIFEFTPNEWRVIFVGVGFALDLLSGVGTPYISFKDLDVEWQNDLKGYTLTYNRLYPILAEAVRRFEDSL